MTKIPCPSLHLLGPPTASFPAETEGSVAGTTKKEEPMEAILVPIALFAMIAVIVVGPRYLKSLERQKMAETLGAAIEKGQSLPPEVIDVLTADAKPPPSPKRDLRRGVIFVAVALG